MAGEPARQRLAERLQGLLYSSRPGWALMPGYVADNFVECVLLVASACEHVGVSYFAHWGTLLGAHRLGGVCPWDEDADLYLIGEDRASVEGKLEAVLDRHGLDLIWDPGGYFWVRQRPWWAGQGHIALEFLTQRPRGNEDPRHEPWIAAEQLLPLRRYPFHGSWLSGPADAEAVLARLYGASGTPAALAGFRAPRIGAETEAFWSAARPIGGILDWDRVSARALERHRARPLGHVATFPWWWFNGAYNLGIQRLQRLGKALAASRAPA